MSRPVSESIQAEPQASGVLDANQATVGCAEVRRTQADTDVLNAVIRVGLALEGDTPRPDVAVAFAMEAKGLLKAHNYGQLTPSVQQLALGCVMKYGLIRNR